MYDYDEDEDDYYEEDEYDEIPEHSGSPGRYRAASFRRQYAGTLGAVLQTLTEYARTLEKEKSNRAEIERKRTAALSVIRSQRQVMIEYLAGRFGERNKLYERYFTLVDTALELRNDEIIRLALESVINIYQDNPFAGLEEFRRQFDSISEVVRI
jgi:predicted S18 family serine protease